MKYDLTVIGSGPGGYIAAIRAAQLGMNVAIIERYSTLGGTCLNVGCIPSKALLDSSEHYHNAVHTFTTHGIDLASPPSVNMPQMVKRKDEVVRDTTKGIEFLMKKNKITVFTGHGSFVTANKIAIKKADGGVEEIETNKTIIATGSKPIVPSNFNYDKKRVITSTEALTLTSVPKSMVVIGGGVIGLELGSVYARLGCEVSVIEFADRIIATMDSDCSKELMKSMKGLGIKFYLKYGVTNVTPSADSVKVEYKKRDTEGILAIEADYCLVAIGRRPYTDNLGLENAGVQKDERGRIAVDNHLQTNVAGIYAIGDVVQGAMLAHKAEEEGVFVAETIAGQKPHINYLLIPGVVYTWPEVAAVGFTEEQLKEAGTPYKAGKFPFKALGRARASMDTDGMVKVLAHAETDEILGVHMVGPRTADMIAEAVALMEFRASAEDASRMSHAHPTYTEAFKEAALNATGNRALNA
ncbi:MAG: dihydrolipoyl dehydrogenase [Saprospiraceae bacterium]|nr:dihydrolipoyl dehydrogenase [Saprospiraceae bacterium]